MIGEILLTGPVLGKGNIYMLNDQLAKISDMLPVIIYWITSRSQSCAVHTSLFFFLIKLQLICHISLIDVLT